MYYTEKWRGGRGQSINGGSGIGCGCVSKPGSQDRGGGATARSIEVVEGRGKFQHSRLRFPSSSSSTEWSRSRAKMDFTSMWTRAAGRRVGHHSSVVDHRRSDWEMPLKGPSPMHVRVFNECSFLFTVSDDHLRRPTNGSEEDMRLRKRYCGHGCLGMERIHHPSRRRDARPR